MVQVISEYMLILIIFREVQSFTSRANDVWTPKMTNRRPISCMSQSAMAETLRNGTLTLTIRKNPWVVSSVVLVIIIF